MTTLALAVTVASGALMAMPTAASAARAWSPIAEPWDKNPPRKTVEVCPPGWTRHGNGMCQAPPPPPETQRCPSGLVIPLIAVCPRYLGSALRIGTKDCPDGSVIPDGEPCDIIVPFPGPFIVFFDWDKAEITPSASAVLDNVAAGYDQIGAGAVALAGHADRSGSDGHNVALSRRRANAVRAYLAARGVPAAAITSEGHGERRPLLETADGVPQPQNRRVEINFGPGRNW